MDYTLKELLDIPRLQSLLQALDELYSVPSAIIDTEGEILVAIAWQDICTQFHRRNRQTERKCIESDRHIYLRLDTTMSPVVYRCPMGLIDAATPIIVDGQHLGNIFTGQLFTEPPDEAYFVEQARTYGFDVNEYLAAMRKVPLFSEEKLDHNLNFLRQLTQMLAEQCLYSKRQLETQEALKKSERNFRSIIEASPIPLATYDEAGNITLINRAFEQSFGYNTHDVPTVAAWWRAAYPDPEYRRWVTDSWQKYLDAAKRTDTPVAPLEATIRCKDGSRRVVVCSATSIQGKFSGENLVILYDVTERQKAEQELSHSHNLMRYIIEHNRSAIAIHDRELRYIYVSQRYLEDYGVKEKDIIGKQHYEVFPDLPQEWRDVHRRALDGEVLSAEDDPYVRDDGRVEWTRWECRPWYEADGSIGGIIVYTEVTTGRKQIEEELRLSKERLEGMMNALPDLMFRIDREGCIYEYHSTASQLLYVPPEEFLGRKIPEILPEEPAGVVMAALAKAAEDGTHRGAVYSLQLPSGTTWFELSVAAMGEPHETADQYIMLVRDITDRMRVEEQLKTSEENHRNISELTSDFVHKCTRTGTDPFRLQWAAGGVRTISGYTAEEVIETGCWLPYVHPDDRERVSSYLFSLCPGDRKTIEFRLITKQGESRWISEKSTCLAGEHDDEMILFGASRDITEQKQYEEALQLIRVSVEAASDAILWIGPDGRIVDVNPAACRSLGYTREELIQLSVPDIDPHYTSEVWERHFPELRKRGTIQLESEQRRKDGRLIPVEIVANYVRFGTEERNCAFVRDITERKEADEQRLKLEQQLLHTQKLESLGVLAGGIAHDFNNLLTAIIGNADLALMRLNPESPAVENLQRIERSAARAADLARQMLAYSGKGTFVVEPIDLNRLVEEMGHMLEVSISKKAVLRYNLATPLPSVQADATQIRQIIMNLVINSSEAIGDKSGVIAINTGCQQCDEKYLQGTWLTDQIPEGFYVFIEVADTGCGMDRATLAKIFDPFFSTKFTGRGLGMSAVLGIVRGHKGTIKVYSEPGKGTTFKVLFPASGRPPEIFNGNMKEDSWKGQGKVLLVDDEETVRAIGSEMLKELGFTPTTAEDGREAMNVYRSNYGFAFVILDLTMPHMDGEQCFRELRNLDPNVKVIMSSGFSEYEVTQKFAGKGLAGFIQKPYKLSALRDVLMQVGKGAQLP